MKLAAVLAVALAVSCSHGEAALAFGMGITRIG